MLHNDLISEFPCDGGLIPVEALSTPTLRVLWCAGCGTEIAYTPDCDWVNIVLAGVKSDLVEWATTLSKNGCWFSEFQQ